MKMSMLHNPPNTWRPRLDKIFKQKIWQLINLLRVNRKMMAICRSFSQVVLEPSQLRAALYNQSYLIELVVDDIIYCPAGVSSICDDFLFASPQTFCQREDTRCYVASFYDCICNWCLITQSHVSIFSPKSTNYFLISRKLECMIRSDGECPCSSSPFQKLIFPSQWSCTTDKLITISPVRGKSL